MMGKDCERILFVINKMIDNTNKAIVNISKLNSPPIKVKAEHTHGEDGSASLTEFIEKESTISMAEPLQEISETLEELSGDLSKLDKLEKGLYTDIKKFNNSIGSPWIEIKRLRSAINTISSYTGEDYVGDRHVVIAALSAVISSAVDAKWAMIFYHDYVQRGFDNIFNNNEPSISFKKNYKTDELDVNRTIGIRNQQYDENVHIKKDNRDPF